MDETESGVVDHSSRAWITIVSLIVIILIGFAVWQAGSDPVEPAAGADVPAMCRTTMQEMDSGYETLSDARLGELGDLTLEVCETSEAWIAAVNDYPGAIGLVDGAAVGMSDLVIRCPADSRASVCVDATSTPKQESE